MIQNFKGKNYINIREYYDSNGELKPGKKVCVIDYAHGDVLHERVTNSTI